MKLIDADKLEYMQIGTNAYVRAEDILSAKPVDVVSVIHGKWINTDDGFRCNRCNHHAPRDNGIWLSNFCPNCGADMRKDGDSNA